MDQVFNGLAKLSKHDGWGWIPELFHFKIHVMSQGAAQPGLSLGKRLGKIHALGGEGLIVFSRMIKVNCIDLLRGKIIHSQGRGLDVERTPPLVITGLSYRGASIALRSRTKIKKPDKPKTVIIYHKGAKFAKQ